MKTTDLPIYKRGYQLVLLSTQIQPDMNRAYRDSVGRQIREASKAILKEISYANSTRDLDRVGHIDNVLELTRAVSIDFRVAADLRLIPIKRWSESIQIIGDLEKQAGGWLKASKKAPDAVGSRLQ